MKNYLIKTSKAFALLMTILLISTAGTIALIVAKVAFTETRTTSSLSDSDVAYQASMAGIEQGLSLYIKENQTLPFPAGPGSLYNRCNLDTAGACSPSDINFPPIINNERFYDLKIWCPTVAGMCGPYINVASIGYYGDVKVKIGAVIDKASKKVISIAE